uniref:Uncharacterized protein n=1 Tax=Rhizophora mucronata TaxID=61149 RepID=A0A2P2PUU3_RHIMU
MSDSKQRFTFKCYNVIHDCLTLGT